MEKNLRKEIDTLFAYIIRSDARIMAIQMTLSDIFKQNEEQKEAFSVNLEVNYKAIHESMLSEMKKKEPEVFQRVYGGIQSL